MTILEMLDALEAGIEALRRKNEELAAGHRTIQRPATRSDVHWTFPVEKSDAGRPEMLRRRMETTGLSHAELAGIFGVTVSSLQDWLAGRRPVPSWTLPSMAVLDLLTPVARMTIRNGLPAERAKRPAAPHPFSRIEEL